MNRAADRRFADPRPHQHLLDAVTDQGPVRQPGQRVVRGQEGKLLLASAQLLVRALALALEGLTHPHQGHLEAALEHQQRIGKGRCRQLQLNGALAHHQSRGVAPAQAALRHLVEGSGALRRQLPEDLPGILADLARDVFALARHPARHGDRRDCPHLREAVLHHGVELPPRHRRQLDHLLDDVRGPLVQPLTEPPKLLCLRRVDPSPNQSSSPVRCLRLLQHSTLIGSTSCFFRFASRRPGTKLNTQIKRPYSLDRGRASSKQRLPDESIGCRPGGQAKMALAVCRVWWLSASEAALKRDELALGIALEGDKEEAGIDLARARFGGFGVGVTATEDALTFVVRRAGEADVRVSWNRRLAVALGGEV